MTPLHDRSWRRVGSALAACLLAVLASAAWTAPAAAQESGDAGRIEALEHEVESLRRALAELEARQRAAEAAAQAAETMAGKEQPAADAVAGAGAAQDMAEAGAAESATAELARRIDLLAAELERLSLGGEVAPEATAAAGRFGLAPAASKVYGAEPGLSIGGYGEMLYQRFDATRDDGADSGRQDEVDFLRAVLYFGYKFNDRLLFNSEIELEHTHEAELEFAYLDYLWRPELNLRGGLVLMPVGLVNELHEPTVFLTARRPDVESRLIPTTWREAGFGVFGDVGPVSYRSYWVGGLDASGYSAAGLRGGRQEGGEATAEDLAWVGRVDVTPRPGLVLGGSLYTGGSGQGITDASGRELSVDTTLYEAHLDWRWRGLEVRALAAHAELDDVAALNDALGLAGSASIGEAMEGFYVEAGYDLWAGGERSLTPYVRWEQLDTQAEVPAGFRRDPARDVESLTVGLSFQPIGQVVLKADYQDYDDAAGSGVDQFNVALGYIF